uniref:Putative proliferation-associated nucleolar protein nol1 n=1 Tax=Panstrongylus megistus TaxID=65343 RepID=A0A069DWE0_9HEMI
MYHLAADICKKVEAGESLKNSLYSPENSKFSKDIPAIRSLVDTTLRNRIVIDDLISRTKLNAEIVFNEIWIARVLVAEIVFGRKSFHCNDEISKKVYQYKEELKNLSEGTKKQERAFIPRFCRINTLSCTKHEFYSVLSRHFKLIEFGDKSKVSYEDFLNLVKKLKKTDYVQDYHLSDLYIFHPKVNLTASPLYVDNKIILQDKASCLVAPLLAPTPGSLMMDMCAAPGFKTQHLSSITGNSGLILAVDICKDRYNVLSNTRINYALSNVITLNNDALHLSEAATKCIEYILLDAPCSGSGVVENYDYGTDNRSGEKRLRSLHNLQAYLLRLALTQYPSARRIVYSTCSLNEQENEGVVDELLDIAEENKFILVNLKNHYQDFTTGLDKYKCGRSTIRMIPEQSCTNGFFIALFERTNPPNPSPRMEFFKNMNSILENISSKKKRKIDEAELNNTEGSAKRKDVPKEILNQTEEKTNTENGQNEIDVVKNYKQKKSSVSPEKENKQVQLQEKISEPGIQILTRKSNKVDKNTESSSSETSDEEELSKEIKLPQVVDKKENYLRVVRSPILKNPTPKLDETHDDNEEEDSEDNDERGALKVKDINFLTGKKNVKIEKDSSSDDSEDSEVSDDQEDDHSESHTSPNQKISNNLKKAENAENNSDDENSSGQEEQGGEEKDNTFHSNISSKPSYKNNFNNSPPDYTRNKDKPWNSFDQSEWRNYENRFNSSMNNSFDSFRNQRRGRGGRAGSYRGRRGYNSNFRGKDRGGAQGNRNPRDKTSYARCDRHI